jgi:hypothetical protein
MSKAIVVKMNEMPFLVETDESVELPSHLHRVVNRIRPETPGDFQEVVDFQRFEREFSDVKNLIVTCCKSLHEAIAKIPQPEKIAVEFGIKLVGETGIPMLTKASGEANFKVNVEWKSGVKSSPVDR